MRSWLLAAIGGALLLFGGGVSLYLHASRSDMQRTTRAARNQLQEQLDSEFSPGVAQVKLVELAADGPKFDASASLLVLGKKVIVPFTVETNGEADAVQIAGGELDRVRSSFQDTLQLLSGKQSDFILNGRFHTLYPIELSRDQRRFAENLGVVDAIKQDENYYYGSGCRVNQCGMDGAAWAIDKKTAHLVVLIAHTNLDGGPRGINVQMDLYGNPRNDNDLPAPLEQWKSDFSESLNSVANDGALLSAMRGVEAEHERDNSPAKPAAAPSYGNTDHWERAGAISGPQGMVITVDMDSMVSAGPGKMRTWIKYRYNGVGPKNVKETLVYEQLDCAQNYHSTMSLYSYAPDGQIVLSESGKAEDEEPIIPESMLAGILPFTCAAHGLRTGR